MPFAALGVAGTIAAVGTAATVATTINGLVNSGGTAGDPGQPGSTTGGSPSTYIPTNQPGADQSLQALQAQLNSQDASADPQLFAQYEQQAQALLNNPYATQAQGNANNIADYYGPNAAADAFQGASTLQGMGSTVAPYGAQILQTGFDPQNALYNRTQQQITDQAQAANAMSGLSGSPYGAGVANQASENFNIDWQNQQLGREQTALQGYGSAVNAAGAAYAGASGLNSQGINTLQSTTSLPYQTAETQGQNNLGALNSLGAGITQAQQPTFNLANSYNSYLGLGQSATQQGLAGQQQGFTQGQTVGSNLGQGLAGLAQGAGGLVSAFNNNSNNVNTPTGYDAAVASANPADYSPAFGY